MKRFIIDQSLSLPHKNPHAILPDNTLFFDSLNFHENEYYSLQKVYRDGDSYIDLVYFAYSEHFGFTLNVSHVQSLIYNGISTIINEFHDDPKLRELFMDSDHKKEKEKEKKKEIEIDITHIPVNPSMINSDLTEDENKSHLKNCFDILDLFENEVQNTSTISEKYKKITQISTSVSTLFDKYSNTIHTMSTLKEYYNFTMYTRCGIPYIDIIGSKQDWQNLLPIVAFIEKYLDRYMEASWSFYLKQTINKIIDCLDGNEDVQFMGDIFKVKNGNGSGAPFYQMGWIHNFIPPLNMLPKFLYKIGGNNEFIGYATMPASISECPVVWDYFGKKINFSFTTSLTSFTIKSEKCQYPVIIPQNRVTMKNIDEAIIRQEKIKKEKFRKEKELEKIQKINGLITEFPSMEENARRLVERDEKEKLFGIMRKNDHEKEKLNNEYQNINYNIDKNSDNDYSNLINLMKKKKI